MKHAAIGSLLYYTWTLQHPLYIKLPENLTSLVYNFHVMGEDRQYKKAYLQKIKVSIRIVTVLTILFISVFF